MLALVGTATLDARGDDGLPTLEPTYTLTGRDIGGADYLTEIRGFAFAPDGETLFVRLGIKRQQLERLFEVNVRDGVTIRAVGSFESFAGPGPFISPDGSRALIVRQAANEFVASDDLVLIDLDTGAPLAEFAGPDPRPILIEDEHGAGNRRVHELALFGQFISFAPDSSRAWAVWRQHLQQQRFDERLNLYELDLETGGMRLLQSIDPPLRLRQTAVEPQRLYIEHPRPLHGYCICHAESFSLVMTAADPGPTPTPDVTVIPFDRLSDPTVRAGVFPSHDALSPKRPMTSRDYRPGPTAQPHGRIVGADVDGLRLWTLDLTTGDVCEFEQFTNDDAVESINPIVASSHDPAWVFAVPRFKIAWGRDSDVDQRQLFVFDAATGVQRGSLSLDEALARPTVTGSRPGRRQAPPRVESIATTRRGEAVVVEISHPDDSPSATLLDRRRTLVVFDTGHIVNSQP